MNNPSGTSRGRFDGLWQIARYNWPQYAAGAAVIVVTGTYLILGAGPSWVRWAAWLTMLPAAWWSVASLAASHWIYDRSELYRWTWIPAVLPGKPRHWLNLHAGLDESSAALRRLFPESGAKVGDCFDAEEMSEPSIRRARAEQALPPATPIGCRHFPFADGAFDAVFVLFAAHEVRRASSREALFAEIQRVLAPSGSILLVEHARDLANFAAFGPGFWHFLPAREWRRLADLVGLEVLTACRMTPFVRIMVMRRER